MALEDDTIRVTYRLHRHLILKYSFLVLEVEEYVVLRAFDLLETKHCVPRYAGMRHVLCHPLVMEPTTRQNTNTSTRRYTPSPTHAVPTRRNSR
jgi:hypothetical protein